MDLFSPSYLFLCCFCVISDHARQACTCLLSSNPFTCNLWLSNKLNLKLAPLILLCFGSSLSASQRIPLHAHLSPISRQFGFYSCSQKIMSFPIQVPFNRFYYLVDSSDEELQNPFITCFHNTCIIHSTVQNQGTYVFLMTTELQPLSSYNGFPLKAKDWTTSIQEKLI